MNGAVVFERPMRVECAWCKQVLKDGREPVSHGICEPCAEAMLKEHEENKKLKEEGKSV